MPMPSERWSGVRAVETFDAQLAQDQSSSVSALRDFLQRADDRDRWDHVKHLVIQGKALSALECAAHDRDWMDQVLQIPPSIFRFGCEAMLDVLPTNCNLFRWKKRSDRCCPLCGLPQTTLHVLNNCYPVLAKYSWRHNSILNAIAGFLIHLRPDETRFLVDLPGNRFHYTLFPPDLCITTQRPDIVLLNASTKLVCVVELTTPVEENIDKAAARKDVKYQGLIDDLAQAGWSAELFTIEVGSRGGMRDSLSKALSRLAKLSLIKRFSKPDLHSLSTRCSRIALRCSYMIWLTRNSASMVPNMPLLF